MTSLTKFLTLTQTYLLAALVAVGARGLASGQAAPSAQQQQMLNQMKQAQKERHESLKRGVVRIDAEKENSEAGTGIVFFSAPNVVRIITALHVVQDAKKITVTFYSDQTRPYPARMLPKFYANLDLAVLEVRTSGTTRLPSDLPKYDFAANDTLEEGQHVTTVNGEWVQAQNSITRLSHDTDPGKFEYSPTAVGEGFSGGPVFNDYGNVIGMHDAMTGSGAYAVAIKIGSALDALAVQGYQVPKAGDVVLPNYGQMAPSTTAQSGGQGEKSAQPFPSTANPARSRVEGRAAAAANSPCANGCTVKLGALRNVGHYNSTMGRANCLEDVFVFPKGWPGDNLFFHANYCPSMAGSIGQAVRLRIASTGKAGDQDFMLGQVVLNGSSGQGILNAESGHWKMTLQNPNYGGVFNINTITLTIQPF